MEPNANTDRPDPTRASAPPRSAQRFFLALLLGALLLLAKTLQPLAAPLFLGAVLAAVLWPLHQRLTRRFRGKRALSAGLFVLGIIVLVLAPLIGFSAFIVKEASEGYDFLSTTIRSEGLNGLLGRLPAPLAHTIQKGVDLLPADTSKLEESLHRNLAAGGGRAASALGAALTATGSFAFDCAMMLIALFFLLLSGKELVMWIDSVAPVRGGQLAELLVDFKQVSYSIIVSSIATSAVQAGAALGGYLITGLPHPFFFAALTFFVSFIPAVGAAAVCMVAALLLYITGHAYAALFLGIWALTAVALIDNVVKTWLIRGESQMDSAVIFFALVGGVTSFGAVGLLLGPLAMSLCLALLRIYQRDFVVKDA